MGTVSYAYAKVKSDDNVTYGLLVHALDVAPRGERTRYPLTETGAKILRLAARRRGLTNAAMGRKMGVTRTAISQLIGAGAAGGATKPTRSAPYLPELCRMLGVSFWAVAAGVRDDERRVLEAMAIMSELAPERLPGLVAHFEQSAHDICKAAGWDPDSDSETDEDDPPGASPIVPLNGPRKIGGAARGAARGR